MTVEHPLSRLRPALLAIGVALFTACSPAATAPAPAAAPAVGASTIDPRLQAIADEEIARAVTEWEAAAGAIVVLDPSSGEILASAGRDHGAPSDVAVRRAYVTGSTLKTITVAAALDEGVVSLTDRFDCGHGARSYGDRTLRDSGEHDLLTLAEVIAVSSNIGASRIFDRLGGEKLGLWLRRFHFGEAPAGIDGAVASVVPARIEDRSFEGGVLAAGEAMEASPLQVAAAYAVLANGGVFVAPTKVRRAGDAPRETILKPETVRTVVTMLEDVVNAEHGTGKLARVEGVRVAGKTGTGDLSQAGGEGEYSSFVGFLPVDHPRFVILVGVEKPRGGESGGKVAAPVFARVAARALR